MIDDLPVNWPAKFADERLDYYYEFDSALDTAAGETRTTFAVTHNDPLLVIETPIWLTPNILKLWISGGTAPSSSNQINLLLTTSVDRRIGRVVILPIKER